MLLFQGAGRALRSTHARAGLVLIVAGEALIVSRLHPVSDFSFPFLWLGYILLLDGGLLAQRGRSPFTHARRLFFVMFPVSAVIWWLFEWFNQAVHNWAYIGGGLYKGIWFVLIASMDFSTVLPAVWLTALAIDTLLPPRDSSQKRGSLPPGILMCVFGAGILCIVLPVLFPSYAFGLIWICMFFLLDPLNYLLGRTSIVERVWHGDWRLVFRFAPAALVCGFFWESWNYWADPKWVYSVPHVGFLHIFEMPLLGYSGYLPFGLELFAMATFVMPFLGFRTPVFESPASDRESVAA
jgi:hypothetical protein